MNRPEGINESAWLAAEQALSTPVWFDGDESPLHEAIARAIQSAVEAERERAAGVADSFADAQRAAWDGFKASGKEGPATSLEVFFRAVAKRIRKGA